jgi:hypothetical protein
MKLMFRDHDHSRVRVWRDTWQGDNFVLMTREAFAAFENQCLAFGIPVIEADDDD